MERRRAHQAEDGEAQLQAAVRIRYLRSKCSIAAREGELFVVVSGGPAPAEEPQGDAAHR